MSCSCMIDMDCYNESMNFYSEKWVIARKDHTCVECGTKIKKGERYERIKGKWESKPETQKTCESCQNIRFLFFCSGWHFGEVWTDIERFILNSDDEVIPWSELGGLPKPARDRICDFIEECWQSE